MDTEDKNGKVIIAPGLKVRHKASQFEYTVDSITTDNSGQTVILLRMPDQPRVKPDEQSKNTGMLTDLSPGNVSYTIDESIMIYEMEDVPQLEDMSLEDDELLAVPQDEFERDYEVR